jgi:histidyl-tRNA synthetase
LHLFTAAGTLSPQTLDRVYSFLDWDGWSGERVVLRPDSTIPTARLYAERLDGGRVAKLFYRQNVFRFTDDGSPREEWQCGVELVGDTGRRGDVEVVLLALACLEPLRLAGLSVCLSHAGIVRAVLAAAGLSPEEQSAAYDRLLDGDLAVVHEVEARMPRLAAPLRMLFEVDGAGAGYLANLRGPLTDAIPEIAAAIDELAFVVAVLEARGRQPRIKAVLARSFEYYSGIVFRVEASGTRVAGGGRYDDLIGLVGGRSVPASGFALNLSPLIALGAAVPEAATASVAVEPAAIEPAALTAATEAADALRSAGFVVDAIAGSGTSTPLVRVGGGAAPFTLRSAAGDQPCDRIEDVLRVLAPDGGAAP